ncbi:hypothetical protein GE21DRAFT_7576 [Neurospora crassa]|uniref:Uncharacterized protein n=1 Tax=Neurospora crassa (strain ATCC 24698 / 74-OR23-1A / CBS 708.71 / DSM 1257 / FGSC 987) TaxID=367110 RepID=Q7S803_NEUCR|nr:hypothetical protein NCU01159 [Neurospora crassa OR74A]EAA32289.1 hypothetical protein NCU01159 [Neurospora crassa OR74A]KHE87715.1 hypothetical protein GE21DRAFT_7576 [Neurospora crassa]|eukprot:XP_961525.1 hypothetical protein NCU01159 [Neurospora crassa OR74A]
MMYISKSKAVKSRCAALNDAGNLLAILAAANNSEVVPMPFTRRDALNLPEDAGLRRCSCPLHKAADEWSREEEQAIWGEALVLGEIQVRRPLIGLKRWQVYFGRHSIRDCTWLVRFSSRLAKGGMQEQHPQIDVWL